MFRAPSVLLWLCITSVAASGCHRVRVNEPHDSLIGIDAANQNAPRTYLALDSTIPPGTIRGWIRDAANLRGLPYSSVYLGKSMRRPIGSAGLDGSSALTAADGSFTLYVVADSLNTMEVRSIGYIAQRFPVRVDRHHGYAAQVSLRRDTSSLGQMIVTGVDKMPLCVVDGIARQIKRPPNDGWPRECIEIDSIAISDRLDPVDAFEKYGEPGRYGAMVFTTKRYRREHPMPALGVKDFSEGHVIAGARLLMIQISHFREGSADISDTSKPGEVVLTPEPGDLMNLLMATDIPASDVDALVRQAKEVIDSVDHRALKYNVIRITVIVCRTHTCAESKESVDEMFVFEREKGAWVYRPDFLKDS